MKSTIFLFFLLQTFTSLATHNKGGEITYRHVGGYQYEVTIITYTRTSSTQADRPTLDSVYFGEGSAVRFVRFLKEDLVNDISRNTYVNQHTYSQQGVYLIHFTDPNWNQGIINIPNSISTPFYIESMLVVFDTTYCPNSSTQSLNEPIFNVQVSRDHHQSVSVYDPDADSVTFELIPCLAAANSTIAGYTFPPDLTIDNQSGKITWTVSGQSNIGPYGVTVRINQWRRGYLVGYVNRVFQMVLTQSNDTVFQFVNVYPFPVNGSGQFEETIQVGDTLRIALYYSDTIDNVDLYHFGETFLGSNPPQVISTPQNHYLYDSLIWVPAISDSRNSAYVFSFRGISFNHNIQNDLTYTVYVPGNRVDSCPVFPFIGIAEMDLSKSQIELYPQPLLDQSILSIKSVSQFQLPAEIFIYDMEGRVIYSVKMRDDHIILNRKDFIPGIYIVALENKNGKNLVGKLVVQ